MQDCRKRVNRLPPVQEHSMIARAVERGVAPAVIAEALGLEVGSVHRKFRLLDGICPEAVDILKDTTCPMNVFEVLRRMSTMRQIEAADLMVGQNNFSLMFAKALLAATPDVQLVKQPRKGRKGDANGPTTQQIARMERELAALQTQVKSVEDSYGIDNLHLTVARGYIAKLLGNALIVRWLSQNRHEYLGEFQRIAEIETIAPPDRGNAERLSQIWGPGTRKRGDRGRRRTVRRIEGGGGDGGEPAGAHQAGRHRAGRMVGGGCGGAAAPAARLTAPAASSPAPPAARQRDPPSTR
jgi:hypothetical protein